MKQIHFNLLLKNLLIGAFLMFQTGCEVDDKDLKLATYPNDPNIFIDTFSPDLNYAAFGGADPRAFQVDKNVKYEGVASMRFAVPNYGSPEGAYAGGVFFSESGRDLSDYDCLTFWAKSSQPASINVIGFGNDLGANKYEVSIKGLKMNTNWKKYYIPIPDASKLRKEKGMFYYSAGAIDDKDGYTFWVDEVKFEKLGTISNAKPSMMNGENTKINTFSGQTHTITGTAASFSLPDGTTQALNLTKDYFTFKSSDQAVAVVNESGIVSIVGPGNADITAKLGDTDAVGSLVITATGSFEHAPTPTKVAADVISIFSDAYTNVPVDFYNGYWAPYQTTTSADFEVGTDSILAYNNFNFVGIQFSNPTVNASLMTNLHLDIFVPTATNAQSLKITVKDFGANGTDGGDDDTSFSKVVPGSELVAGKWNSIDISMNGQVKSKLGQIILEDGAGLSSFFVDNIYFYKGERNDAAPTTAAPTPTHDPSKVKSIFSNAYTNVPVDTYITEWSAAKHQLINVVDKPVLQYYDLDYVAIETKNPKVNAKGMTHLHVDVWSPNLTNFKIKLSDFGASGSAEVSHATIDKPAPPKSEWVSYDIPLSEFGGLASTEYLGLLLFSGTPTNEAVIYVDNIYFYDNGSGGNTGTTPTTAAPTPTQAAAKVISIFSDTYPNVLVNSFRTDWSEALLSDVSIAGNAVKKYSNLTFVGIETTSPTINASNMTHFHLDAWSPNFTKFSIKLVDFGTDGVHGGGDDVEHQIDFDAPAKSAWVSYDIPLSNFTGLTNRGHIAQYILVAQPSGSSTVFVDNIYFYDDPNGGNTGGGGGNTDTAPTTAAPTPPARNAANVKSIFSSAYTNIIADTYITEWSAGKYQSVSIVGKPVLKYYELDYAAIKTESQRVGISGMTHVHVDVWSPNFTNFKIKLSDAGPSGSAELSYGSVEKNLPLKSQWVSYDIPLTDFVGLNQSGYVTLSIFSGTPVGGMTLYVDNFYFYKQ